MKDSKRFLIGTLEIIAFGISLAAIKNITGGDILEYIGFWGLIPYFGAAYLCGDGIRRTVEGTLGNYKPLGEQVQQPTETQDLNTSPDYITT